MTVELQWKERYDTGFEEIDGQHKMIMKAINMLLAAISKHSVDQEMGKILDLLEGYIQNHFATEEKYFEKFKYEHADEHIGKHREFAEKISAQRKKFQEGKEEISFELIDFLEDWMFNHVLMEDAKYIECFMKNGLK